VSDETKNIIDVLLAVIGMIGAVVAYIHTLRTWREGQHWRRAEQLDKFIERFEADEMLKLACLMLDWTFRKTEFRAKEITIRNDDVLIALRLHGEEEGDLPIFTQDQALIRDMFDALLAFFGRLDVALASRLIDRKSAKLYFSYWLERFITMDRHPDESGVLNGLTPDKAVASYVSAYGDPQSLMRLCNAFDLDWTTAKPSLNPGGVDQRVGARRLG
jgi:hypothetical protein